MMRHWALVLLLAGTAGAAAAGAQEDLAQARAIVEKAVADHPRNAELRVHLGFIYRKLSMPDAAQAQFESAVQADPQKGEAFYMLGLIYEKKGLKPQAIAAWKSCLASAREDGMKETAKRHLHLLENTRD